MDTISAAVGEIQKQCPDVDVRFDELMKNHTSFKIGGPVPAMLFPKSQEEAVRILEIFTEYGVEPFVMGNGTNLLCSDSRMELAVIKTAGLCEISLSDDGTIHAGSGVLLSRLASFAMENGLCGLEFAHGIPGSLGGAVAMNAGAYGGEMKDVVCKTVAWGKNGVFTLAGDEHDFSYRHSAFSENGAVALSSYISVQKGNRAKIREEMDKLAAKRKASQPLNFPSAGSTFKRPANGYAAAMIDEAGLKGYTVGGAGVSEKHAGFVVNTGGATFDDVIHVMEHVKETVYKKTGVMLEPEVKIIKG